MTAIETIVRHGKALHACGKLREGMTTTEAINALFSPQGREFCSKQAFPSLEDLAALREENKSLFKRKRIHVNEAANELLTKGQGTVIAGAGESRVHCEGQGCFDIIIGHGADVYISAAEYAVVRVTHIGKAKHQFNNIDNTAVLI